MPISDTKKLDILWKKIFHGVTETDAANKDGLNEAIPTNILLLGHEVWSDSADIPIPPPAETTKIVRVLTGENAIELVRDVTATGNRAWIARDSQGNRVVDWIPPSIDPEYLVTVSVTDPATGAQLNPLSTNQEWVFDYIAGVLYFPVCVPLAVTAQTRLWIEGYQYIGTKGVGSGGGGTSEGTVVGSSEVQIAGSVFGKPPAATVVMRFVTATRMHFVENLVASQGRCTTLPTNKVEFQLFRNGSLFGKMVFNPDTSTIPDHYATFISLPVTFFPKDELLVISPDIQDDTLANLEWTLVALSI